MDYEKFGQTPDIDARIESKFLIWQDLINEASVSEKTKQDFMDVLRNIKIWPQLYDSLENAIYYTVNQLITIYEKDPDPKEAKALFENIRDDIWPLVRK